MTGPHVPTPSCSKTGAKRVAPSADVSVELRQAEQRVVDLEILLEEKEVNLAATREQLRTIERKYDDICNSLVWRGTEPFRKLLDHLKAWRGIIAGIRLGIADMFVRARPGTRRGGDHWLERIKDCSGRVAIVQSVFGVEELANLRLNSLVNYLVHQNYLVIYVAWPWQQQEGPRQVSFVNPNLINVTFAEFLNKIEQLACCPKQQKLFVLTFPAETLVRKVAVLRRAGFAVMYDIMDDWEVLHSGAQGGGYTRESEEQAVLAADLVSASSESLRDKFNDLRKDVQIVRVTTNDILAGQSWDMPVADLLSRVEKGTSLASLYA